MDESQSNRVVHLPERDPVPRPLVPAPSGGDSSTSLAETIWSVATSGVAFAGSVVAAIPSPTLAALLGRSQQGTPSTYAPQIRAATPAEARAAIAPPASSAQSAGGSLLTYAGLAWLAYRWLR